MPAGWLNWSLAALILTAKLLLLPRVLYMPAFATYLLTACFTTVCYIAGWRDLESAWEAALSVLANLAAVEAVNMAVAQSDEERLWIFRWGISIGAVICLTVFLKGPDPYPNYSQAIYFTRLYAGAFAVGFLTASTMYCFAQSCGVKFYLAHCWILLARIAGMSAILLVHDRTSAVYFLCDLVGIIINVLTLCGWLLLMTRAGRRAVA